MNKKAYGARYRDKKKVQLAAYDVAYQIENKAAIATYKADYYQRNKLHWRKKRVAKYGLTLKQFDDMRVAQGFACAVCDTEEWLIRDAQLHVDHDHMTGAVRGLLCSNCNMAIGIFKDDPALLHRAIQYLLDKKFVI